MFPPLRRPPPPHNVQCGGVWIQLLAGVDNEFVLTDPDQLEEIGLTLYERKSLMALMLCGVADAATLCREGAVPSSKIYLAMEKLAARGLVQVQPTRPRLFAALPADALVARVVEIAHERAQ